MIHDAFDERSQCNVPKPFFLVFAPLMPVLKLSSGIILPPLNNRTPRAFHSLCVIPCLSPEPSVCCSLPPPCGDHAQNVRGLRSRQFPEDAGPLSHPIRPESYIAMDNFYTATVYIKGAEVTNGVWLTEGGKVGIFCNFTQSCEAAESYFYVHICEPLPDELLPTHLLIPHPLAAPGKPSK